MPETLTTLIAKMQAQLLDTGSLFSTPTCTAAFRQALSELNKKAPQQLTVTVTTISNQHVYEVTDQDITAQTITDVLLEGSGEYDTPLAYAPFVEDGRLFFRLSETQAAGKTLDVHYTAPHTISGLDSATDTTLTDELVNAILNGACAYGCRIRAAATIESNNVQTNVPENWLKAASNWDAAFRRALAEAVKEPTPHGEPNVNAWNDPQHRSDYP